MKAMPNLESSDINDYISPGKIFMFSKMGCPYCVTAKSILKKLNVPFEVLDQESPTNFKEVGKCDFKRFATFHHEMIKKGFYFACSQYEAGFMCTKITNQDIDDCLNAASQIMKNL